jgi:chromosome segregation ATPase
MASKFFARQKQKFFGKDKTVDDEFEAQRVLFKKLRDTLKDADKHVRKVEAHLKELANEMNTLAADVATLYDLSQPEVGERLKAAANQFAVASVECGDAVGHFGTYLREKLDQCSLFASRIDKRDDALLYADAKRDSLASLKEKPPKEASKMDEAQQKYDAALRAYEELNDPLIPELVAFSGDRTADFEPRYRAFLAAQLRFAATAARVWKQFGEQHR